MVTKVTEEKPEAPKIDGKVIDGAAIIDMLKLTYGKAFRGYAINTFVSYISSLLRQVKRVDLVGDRYFAESLKNCTRENVELGSVERLPVIAFIQQTGWCC